MKPLLVLMMVLAGLAFAQRFSFSGGAITDNDTGLRWRVGLDQYISWDEAKAWVDGLGRGWRMPTLAELRALYDAGITCDNWGLFQNSVGGLGCYVWSGEVRDSSSAWAFSFRHGGEDWGYRRFAVDEWAFAVRSL